MEHTSLCASISALLEQNDAGEAEWWQTAREHLAEAEKWAHMECLRLRMNARAEQSNHAYSLTVGPDRKGKIRSFIENAIAGRPRRWAFMIPKPTPGGAIRGVANSWREAMDAVDLHQKAMRQAEERRHAEREAAGRHRPAGSDRPYPGHAVGEAAGIPHSFVSAPGRGRHASGTPVVTHPPRDFALAALAGPAERPGYGAMDALDRLLNGPPPPTRAVDALIEEMKRSGAVR